MTLQQFLSITAGLGAFVSHLGPRQPFLGGLS